MRGATYRERTVGWLALLKAVGCDELLLPARLGDAVRDAGLAPTVVVGVVLTVLAPTVVVGVVLATVVVGATPGLATVVVGVLDATACPPVPVGRELVEVGGSPKQHTHAHGGASLSPTEPRPAIFTSLPRKRES